jgi:SAM-dependent methyltransferase
MNQPDDVKSIVKEKYSEIASQSKEQNETSCCGSACGCSVDYAVFSEDYSKLKGYNPDADLGLGCGIPTQFAGIKEGHTVIDLGSGAGNDVFVARSLVGTTGKVIGVDMTEAMIEKARRNNEKLGYVNVEFRLGDIEKLPVTADRADVVVSNCVLNLVPDKKKAFGEIYRVLKPGGHFAISDVVIQGKLPNALISDAEMYAGCVAGALAKEEYLDIIRGSGFTNVSVKTEKQVVLPDALLLTYLSPAELDQMKSAGTGIKSITVYAEKPADASCCSGGSTCC